MRLPCVHLLITSKDAVHIKFRRKGKRFISMFTKTFYYHGYTAIIWRLFWLFQSASFGIGSTRVEIGDYSCNNLPKNSCASEIHN